MAMFSLEIQVNAPDEVDRWLYRERDAYVARFEFGRHRLDVSRAHTAWLLREIAVLIVQVNVHRPRRKRSRIVNFLHVLHGCLLRGVGFDHWPPEELGRSLRDLLLQLSDSVFSL